jgi:hypothetical protein
MLAFLTFIWTTIAGTSLFAIRLLPALAGAGTVLLTGLIARELGGKRYAVFLSCLAAVAAPAFLGIDTFLSMNALEPLFWMACVLFAVLAVNRKEPKYWLGFGALAGLGAMNKHTMFAFIFAMLVGIVLTKERRALATRWFWIGAAVGFLIFLPNLIWQFQHDFASYETIMNVKATGKNVSLSPLEFVWQQILVLNPLTSIIWIAGIWYYLFTDKKHRCLGIAYLVVLAIMIITKGKFYYLLPAYPMLFAAGAVYWERRLSKRALWLKAGYPVALILTTIIVLPTVLPILPVESYIKYQDRIGVGLPKTEVGHSGPLPQLYGDMFGWPEMVAQVAKVYQGLSPTEREKATILAENYGEAGAIDLFGPAYGLPKAISGHENYYQWGPGNNTGEVIIALNFEKEDATESCESVEESLAVGHPYAMAQEHYTILICRGLKAPLSDVWPSLKKWN